jgi:hypothetical protein
MHGRFLLLVILPFLCVAPRPSADQVPKDLPQTKPKEQAGPAKRKRTKKQQKVYVAEGMRTCNNSQPVIFSQADFLTVLVAPNAVRDTLNEVLDGGMQGLSSLLAQVDSAKSKAKKRLYMKRIEAVSELMSHIGKVGGGHSDQHVFIITNAARMVYFKQEPEPPIKDASRQTTFIKIIGTSERADELQRQLACEWDGEPRAILPSSGAGGDQPRNEL